MNDTHLAVQLSYLQPSRDHRRGIALMELETPFFVERLVGVMTPGNILKISVSLTNIASAAVMYGGWTCTLRHVSLLLLQCLLPPHCTIFPNDV